MRQHKNKLKLQHMKRGFFLLGEQIYNLSRAVWQKLRYSFRCSPEFQLFAEEAERINQQRARFRSNSSTCASTKNHSVLVPFFYLFWLFIVPVIVALVTYDSSATFFSSSVQFSELMVFLYLLLLAKGLALVFFFFLYQRCNLISRTAIFSHILI